MKRRRSEESWVAVVREEYLAARARSSTEGARVIDRYAKQHGINRSTLFRKLGLGLCSRRASEAEELLRRKLDAYALDVWNHKRQWSRDDAEVSIVNAFEDLVKKGRIPAHITLHQIYQSIRRQHLVAKSQPIAKRFERRTPLSMVQIDYTVSRYFKNAGGGYVVMHDPKHTYKPSKDEERVWIASAVDDASRVMYAEFVFSAGENLSMVHDFLMSAFAAKQRVIEATGEIITHRLYQGIPKAIYWDRSGSHKSSVTIELLENMGVEVITGGEELDREGNPTGRSNKKAHGKVERNNGHHKQGFEQKLWLELGPKKTLTIEELNERLTEWLIAKNSGFHPMREGRRWDIFEPALMEARYPDENALAVFGTRYKRRVRSDGTINVGRHKFAIAPVFVSRGDEVEIVHDHGSYYLIEDGARHLLAMQNEEIPEERNERSDDVLAEWSLRERFDAELRRISDGELSIRAVKESHQDDLEEFFSKARTIDEIKSKARIITIEKQKPQTTNIIPARTVTT